jgi:hypothetical protein
MKTVLSFQKLFIIGITKLFFKFTSFRSDFFLDEIIDAVGIVKINVCKISIIESPVEHNTEILPLAQLTL